MIFKFENYRTPEEAKEQLNYVFPKGTELNKFVSAMKAIGAKCYDAQTDEESNKSIYCHYIEAGFFVHNTWIVGVEVDNDKKIITLSVERGYTGT